ncbi:MAG TPA: A/G-specific adenine glycosylase [Candidatus Binatia bacterium]|nr:A/G-specific adenine glycosylase [Candidatus Binatia bacterium]
MTGLQRRLLRWYSRHGRADLPWRVVRDPYRTVVSEFMAVQTQVGRVAIKFASFVERFPDFRSLAAASTADVVREWRGLGYNSRAVRLRELAKIIIERHGGALPTERDVLRALPGVGPYTAAAVRVFAHGIDDAPVDVNVRRIVQRLCFGLEYPRAAAPRAIEERARALVPRGRAHDWISALMDLGTTLCTARAPKCPVCPLAADCAAAPVDAAALERLRKAKRRRGAQGATPFERSSRYARGRIVDRLRDLPAGERISLLDLQRELRPSLQGRSLNELRGFVEALERDGLVTRDGNGVALRE